MKTRDIKLILVIIVTFFLQCYTQYSRYTFHNVTVHLKVSDTTHPWKKIFLSQARNITEFIRKSDAKVKIIAFKKQQIPVLLRNSIIDVSRLKRIKLNGCGVCELEPGCLKNVTKILEFDLSSNQIRDVKYGVFNNMGISRLFLNNNKIHEIQPKAFANMTNLEMIILSGNRLTIWDSSWFLQTPVRHIDFSSNMIEKLPSGAFDYFKEFKRKKYGEFYYVNFNNNVLTKLTRRSLPEVPFLWFLFLESNFIEEIDGGCFDGIQKMEALKLGKNKIVNFPNEILGQMDLRYLKLNDNYLKVIDVNITEILNIEGNPLNKDCKVQWDERKKRDRNLFERYFYDM